MDNVTHSLFGATLARTPLGRAGRGATTALVLSSNAPDIDIVTAAGGALRYLEWHRGPTHGPLGVVGLGLATAAIVWIGSRAFDREAEHAPFGRLVLVSTVGVLCHVLMDLPTSYGTRVLSPFSWTWFGVDWMPIIEIYLLIALAAGLLFGSLTRVGRRGGQRDTDAARRRNAVIALLFMMVIYGVRAAAHHRAIALAPRVFGPILPERCPGTAPQTFIDRWPRHTRSPGPSSGRCLVEIAAMPDFVSPFRWRLVAQLSNAYESQMIHVLDPRLRQAPGPTEALWRRTVREPNQWTPLALAAAETEVGRVFLGFSRFPAARTFLDGDGLTTVRWSDMRYIPPGLPREANTQRRGFFSATVQMGHDGEVVDARVGP